MTARPLLLQLTQLFAEKQKQLYVAALTITKDRAAAEDAVLDALLAVAELQQTPENLSGYVYRTVRNKAMHSNKMVDRFNSECDYTNFIDQKSQTVEQQIFLTQIMRELEKLEINQQQVLVMKLFGDLTFDEIAEVTANNPNTVASWYRRGLAKLKETILETA